jgi:propionyl-CoA synthetase
MGRYQEEFSRSLEDPERFWAEAAAGIDWYRKWGCVLDDDNPPFYRWFTGGELNTCHNCLDRHVDAGRGDHLALIHDSPVTESLTTFSYRELRDRVARFAGAMLSLGIQKGDRVIIYMPMVPEAVIAMLACARLGAVHSVVFGGFAANELAIRIDHARPKLLVTASGAIEGTRVLEYKPLVDKAFEIAEHEPDHCVILQRDFVRAEPIEGRDLDWVTLEAGAQPVACVPVKATDPLYILYTSGTTGLPKGIVRDNGGHAVALHWSMENVYGVGADDVFWTASDVGWVVGYSYTVYAPLLVGCTTVLYEGKPVGTPDAGAFWRVIAQHGVNVLFTAPTAFRAIRKEDPEGAHLAGYDLGRFRALFLAGERLDPDTYDWATEKLGVPVIDHWWQTESGWPMVSNCLGIEPLPLKAGSPTLPVPGYDVRILGPDGQELGPDEEGAVVVKLPLPPGALPTLWEADERYVDTYLKQFPGYYVSADGGHRDADGYLFIMGRTDDVINVSGHRLTTGAIEEVLAAHSEVAECAVIGAEDALKGQVPVGLVVLKDGSDVPGDTIKEELRLMVRGAIGPVACYRETAIVERLPKTRSGKILRVTMRKIADGKEYVMPSTIAEPAVLLEMEVALRGVGYPRA